MVDKKTTDRQGQKGRNGRDDAIVVEGLHKSYKDQKVLKGIDFTVRRGTVLALLGPNGAGKTTTVRILSTLLRPDSGRVVINGYDIVRQDSEARASIGLTGQYAAVDEYLTGQENLYMIGRLYRMSREDARRRTDELLEQFDLVEASTRAVKTYSGGMRRRLDLAMSLIASPPIIFLDEPTTGLDPRSRITMWDMIKQLVRKGTTVLLTTQYMEEADQLADEIIVIDNGEVIAEGTADQLKAKIGSDHLEIIVSSKSSLQDAAKAIDNENLVIESERRLLSIATKGGVKELKDVLNRLGALGIEVESVELRRPTLDDVFLSLTGHSTGQEEKSDDKKQKGAK